jgi:hypothetical protein
MQGRRKAQIGVVLARDARFLNKSTRHGVRNPSSSLSPAAPTIMQDVVLRMPKNGSLHMLLACGHRVRVPLDLPHPRSIECWACELERSRKKTFRL